MSNPITPNEDTPTSPDTEEPTGFAIHRPLKTGLKHAPWMSVVLLCLIWFTFGFHIFSGGTALTYTLKGYNDDPRVYQFITSLAIIIMLGPFVNYLSDIIWTKMGRRKPFVLISWIAGAIGMGCVPFAPQITTAINGILGPLGIPYIGEFTFLIIVVVTYTSLYDFTAPLEPLFLECVPPKQRGRFWAMRNVVINLSSLLFFQVFWPVYDETFAIFSWIPGYEGHLVKGEHAVYYLSSLLFLITGFVLVFCVKEVKGDRFPNMRLSEVNIVRYITNFFKDVFLAKNAYPFYIVLVIPSMTGLVWQQLVNVMLTDQFGYSKANMALMGLPPMLISIFLMTPFAGWYTDRKPQLGTKTCLAIFLAASSILYIAIRIFLYFAPQDRMELPSLWQCFLMNTLIAMATTGYLVIIVEMILRRSNRVHMKAWVSLIAIVKDMSFTICLYLIIHYWSEDQTPSITLWMFFGQVGSTTGTLVGIVVGPMIFEYIPRMQLGTIIAGSGIYRGIIGFFMANLGANWAVWYSQNIQAPVKGKTDFSSIYLLQIILFIPALIATIYFVHSVLKGKILPMGIAEIEGVEAVIDPALKSTDSSPKKH